MNVTLKTFAAISFLAFSGLAAAGSNTPGVDAREHRQAGRIAHGASSGQLTHVETKYLVSQQRKTAKLERAFKADGQVTQGERHILHKRLNRTSASIYRQKHDLNFR